LVKVLLIDVDSKIPNLALMKISAWHKKQGDEVYLNEVHNPNKVYISCIFDENKAKALGIIKIFKMFNCFVEIGGYGVSDRKLPKEIEHIMPDYDLFNCSYSIGFTTRGCIRKCPFCIVWRKEGNIRVNSDIYEFWDRRHKHIVLLDNNILALPNHFEKISRQILKEKLTVDFNQGLDIRLLDNKSANLLKKLKVKPELRFAFDDIKIENEVIKGLKILKKNGINRAMWYVLVGFNSTIKDDLYRLQLLKENGQHTYVMRYKTCRGKKIYNDLAAWASQPQFFKSMTFERFRECRKDRSLVNQWKDAIENDKSKD